uniref:Uncharacterized protein n=1 Tax=Anguilla anguilla TaxID=7936 RepID=A0A0E9WJX1_ANGAN
MRCHCAIPLSHCLLYPCAPSLSSGPGSLSLTLASTMTFELRDVLLGSRKEITINTWSFYSLGLFLIF